MIDRTTSDSF